jgi:hypothetical protein
LAADPEAVVHGHIDIENDKIEVMASGNCKGVSAIRGAQHLVAIPFQALFKPPYDTLFIVHNQNSTRYFSYQIVPLPNTGLLREN